MTADHDEQLILPFTVAWAAVEPAYQAGEWSCIDMKTKSKCANTDGKIRMRYEDGFHTGNFTIEANTFKPDSKITIRLNIKERESKLSIPCLLNLDIQSADVLNIPLKVHSDVGFNTFIDTELSHSFGCHIDHAHIDESKHKLIHPFERNITYTVSIYESKRWQKPRDAIMLDDGHGMKINPGFFMPRKYYVFICNAEYTPADGSKPFKGKVQKFYNTAVWKDNVEFNISPRSGVPFLTEFKM